MNNQCGKRKKLNGSNLEQLSVQELIYVARKIAPYISNINLLDRQHLCNIVAPYYKQNKGFLQFHQNSCYLDSLFVAFFAIKSKWIIKNFLKNETERAIPIRNCMRYIYSMLHNSSSFSNLKYINSSKCRKNLSHIFHGRSDIEWQSEQNDVNEIVIVLADLFDIKEDVKVQNMANKIYWYYFGYPSHILKKYKKVKIGLSSLYNMEGDRVIVNKTKGLIYIQIARADIYKNLNGRLVNKKINTPVISKKQFYGLDLKSILIHHGNNTHSGHYTCVYFDQQTKQWIWFDNLKDNYKIIGKHLKNLWEIEDGFISHNCVGFLYSL